MYPFCLQRILPYVQCRIVSNYAQAQDRWWTSYVNTFISIDVCIFSCRNLIACSSVIWLTIIKEHSPMKPNTKYFLKAAISHPHYRLSDARADCKRINVVPVSFQFKCHQVSHEMLCFVSSALFCCYWLSCLRAVMCSYFPQAYWAKYYWCKWCRRRVWKCWIAFSRPVQDREERLRKRAAGVQWTRNEGTKHIRSSCLNWYLRQ